jgi:hypothetical protein
VDDSGDERRSHEGEGEGEGQLEDGVRVSSEG